MATKTRFAVRKAQQWINYYEGTYKRDKHDVILDEPFIIEMFDHNGLLYLKDQDNFLWHPVTCDTIRSKEDIPQVWNPVSQNIVDCDPDDLLD